MNYGKYFFITCFFVALTEAYSDDAALLFSTAVAMHHKHKISNDAQAYEFCRKNPQSFVAVVWPIAQGKSKEIQRIFKRYGKIHYAKKTYFDYSAAYKLLQKAHPQIPDMHDHVRWYFPQETFQKPARIFVLEFDSMQTAIACKMAIRRMYNLQYRAIHINDNHAETMDLAQFFFV